MYVGIYGSHSYPFSRSYQRNAITLTILLLCFLRSLALLDFISPARFEIDSPPPANSRTPISV
jgi:hypothetical protein